MHQEGVVPFTRTFLLVEVGPDLVHLGRGSYARESHEAFYANKDAWVGTSNDVHDWTKFYEKNKSDVEEGDDIRRDLDLIQFRKCLQKYYIVRESHDREKINHIIQMRI